MNTKNIENTVNHITALQERLCYCENNLQYIKRLQALKYWLHKFDSLLDKASRGEYDDYFKETYKYENISEETTKFTYKLTGDGYVESVTMIETDLQTNKYSYQDKNGDGVISDDERNITDTRTYTNTSAYTFEWE